MTKRKKKETKTSRNTQKTNNGKNNTKTKYMLAEVNRTYPNVAGLTLHGVLIFSVRNVSMTVLIPFTL